MDKSRYADLFRTESREQLSAINRALLSLEHGEAPREPVDAIFRGVHTMKGMSATMGLRGPRRRPELRWPACARPGLASWS